MIEAFRFLARTPSRILLTVRICPVVDRFCLNPFRIQRMMIKRDKYLRKSRRTKNLETEYLYKKFRNKVVLETRKNRIDYFNNYFNTHKNNMKKLWSGIRSIVNVSKNRNGIHISHLLQDGKEVDDPKKMANIFNNFFVNVSKKLPVPFQGLENPL